MERARVRVTGVVKKTEAQATRRGQCFAVLCRVLPFELPRQAWAEKDRPVPGPATAKAQNSSAKNQEGFSDPCTFPSVRGPGGERRPRGSLR